MSCEITGSRVFLTPPSHSIPRRRREKGKEKRRERGAKVEEEEDEVMKDGSDRLGSQVRLGGCWLSVEAYDFDRGRK